MFPTQYENLQIMSHAVIGFPSLEENEKAISGLADAGVNLIELQVPFSDPVADGHTLVNACYEALICIFVRVLALSNDDNLPSSQLVCLCQNDLDGTPTDRFIFATLHHSVLNGLGCP